MSNWRFSKTLPKLCVSEHHGLMTVAPAGIGMSASRKTCSIANIRPPPAESPQRTMSLGGIGSCPEPCGGSTRCKSAASTSVSQHYTDMSRLTRCDDVLKPARKGVLRRLAVINDCSPMSVAVAQVITRSTHQRLSYGLVDSVAQA